MCLPARRTPPVSGGLLNQSRKALISPGARSGSSKWTRSRPTGPETTCTGPVRQAPASLYLSAVVANGRLDVGVSR